MREVDAARESTCRINFSSFLRFARYRRRSLFLPVACNQATIVFYGNKNNVKATDVQLPPLLLYDIVIFCVFIRLGL